MSQKTARTARRQADFEFALAAGSHAPAEARQELASRLPAALPQSLVDDMMLLATELVTNSVRHAPQAAEGTIDVSVSFLPGVVRVEVRDPGSGFSHVPQRPGTLSEGGRGLFLVEVIADRWGNGPGEQTAVWFELEVDRDETTSASAIEPVAGAGPSSSASEVAGTPNAQGDVTVGAMELAAELRELGAATESLDRKTRSIEQDLDRVTSLLKHGAERLRTREKLAPETNDDSG